MGNSYTTPILMGGGPALQSIYDVSTTALHTPGTRARMNDGREFEYVRSDNSTAIGRNKLATYDPMVAAWDKITLTTAQPVGSTQIIVPLGATTLLANELNGGWISIDNGTGELYRIIGHAASSGSADCTFVIDRPIVTALTTSSVVSFNFGPCAVKISAGVTANAEAVEVAAGVPLVDIPAGNTTPQYFWVQKTGRAAVLFGTAVGGIGLAVYHGEDAGSFQVSVDTTAQNAQVVLGTTMALLPVDGEYHQVMLSIA